MLISFNKEETRLLFTQALCILIIPLFSLLLSLRYYKLGIAQFFFILYAFYFGYQVDVQLDLSVHYDNFLLFCKSPLEKALQDPYTSYLGAELFPLSFKAFLSRFTSESRLFSAFAATIYATLFVLFIRQFRAQLHHKLSWIEGLLFCGMCFTVEFYWYWGLRFWLGAFFFMTFYIKYIFSEKISYFLVGSLSGILFHNALLFLPIIEIGNRLLKTKIKIFFFIISFFLRHSYVFIITSISQIPLLDLFVSPKYLNTNEHSLNALLDKGNFVREEGNIIYQMRFDILYFCCLFLFFLLWRKNRKITKSYPRLLGFILLLTAICNLLYENIIFFQRFYKMSTVLFFAYLFLVVQKQEQQWIKREYSLLIPLALVIFYSILTAIVEQRDVLLSSDLWFGNFILLLY